MKPFTRPAKRPPRYLVPTGKQPRIHRFKRLMRAISRIFPSRARFFLFGLPERQPEALAPNEAVVFLPNGIASAIGAHLTPQGRYLSNLTPGAGPFIETRFLQKQRCFPRITRASVPAVSLISEGQLNYYRWLMETLPRLRYIRESGVEYQQIYACQSRPFHRESLAALLPPGVEIIASNRCPNFASPDLIVPRFIDEDEPWILPWLRNEASRLLSTDAPSPRRIYISRRDAKGRQIVNEPALAELLASFGFTEILLENLPWPEQARLFRGAEAVIAPHGAGLANIVFCEAALVIELIADAYPFTFYPQISRQLGLNHHCVSSAPVDPSNIHASDLMAPIDTIRSLLTGHLTR